MLAEFIDLHGAEVLGTIATACISFIMYQLRKRGLEQAASIIDAASPYIVDAITKGRKGVPTTGDFAMREAKKAALGALPLSAKVLAPMATKKIAQAALQNQYDNGKRIKSIGIGATVDGKQLGAEIKAGFRNGDIRATIGSKDGTLKAFAGGTFKF